MTAAWGGAGGELNMYGKDWSGKQTFAFRGRRSRFVWCGGSRAWTSLRGVGLRTCMTVHHDRLRVLGILRVGVGGIGKGGVRERGMLHRVRRARIDWGPWRSLTGSVLWWLLLRI